MTSEILSATSDIISAFAAIAVIAAAFYGGKKIKIWEERSKKGRRLIHAERIIVAAYQARSSLLHIRSSISLDGQEHDIARKDLKEIFKDKGKVEFSHYQVNGMVCINRWNDRFDSYNELYECMPFAKAFFGNDLYGALMSIARKFNRVRRAADSLAAHRIDDKRAKDLYEIVFDKASSEDDIVENEINEQVDIIEGILFPVIRPDEDSDK